MAEMWAKNKAEGVSTWFKLIYALGAPKQPKPAEEAPK